MNVDLTALATSTVRHLGLVWDQIGAPTSERDIALDALTAAIKCVYTSTVDAAEKSRDQLIADIASVTESINTLVARLAGVNGVATATDDTAKNLRARLAALTQQLSDTESIKAEHVTKLDAALASLHALWTQLGTKFESGFEKMTEQIDAQRLTDINAYIQSAQQEMLDRTELVKMRIMEIGDLVHGLCIDDQEVVASELLTNVMQHNVDAIGVHATTMLAIDQQKADLIAEKLRRQERLKRLAVKITALWDRLSISATERQAFFGQHRGLGLQTLDFCESELIRLEQMKQDKLQEMTEELRVRLHAMWDECHYAQSDRLRFAPLSATQFTDEVFDAHEAEVKQMEVQVQAMRPILVLIERRSQILRDKAEYEEMLKNPNRFKIAGWSIREEGIRKMLNKELPKLNAKLLDDLNAYEASYGELLYEGVQYRACLQGEVSSQHSAEEEEKSRKERERAKNFQGQAAAASVPITPRKPVTAAAPVAAAQPKSSNPENVQTAPSPQIAKPRANQFGFASQVCHDCVGCYEKE
jgi:protein regulator of cytokinesis 1